MKRTTQNITEPVTTPRRHHQRTRRTLGPASLFLLEFRDTIETKRRESAQELGLSETEYAFHGIPIAELTKLQGEDSIREATVEKVKTVVRERLEMMDEASTEIVDFFQKSDEQADEERNPCRNHR